ncbi:MAG: hypothetical protein E6J90_20475 [Deltaproteobacteria bacterium]|nr:MAG: hypothetical protein E6J91_38745 [Deltaproteobacteria bacterium]TMQ18288.1 MAG: hypothetical protein E6J90_20475 [Deltaproteobacteria bacterium]
MGRRAMILDWNGKDLPSELHDLPAGRYLVEAVDDVSLTEDEDRGVEHALEQYRNGATVDAAQARQIFDSLLKR